MLVSWLPRDRCPLRAGLLNIKPKTIMSYSFYGSPMPFRKPGTSRSGSSFTEATIQAVWEKAIPVAGFNPAFVRKDTCGAFIERKQYGNTSSKYGWEIDHIKPVSKDGPDVLSNLQPLQWENNRHKSDSYPYWSCKLKAA